MMDAQAVISPTQAARADYAQMAVDWRMLAAVAEWQDQWTAEHLV
jgi:hypothetical protein